MKSARKSSLAGLMVVVLAAAFSYAESFEGTIQMAISTPTLKNEATAYIKGMAFRIQPKAAVQMEGVEGYPIVDFEAKKFYIVSPKDKYYVTLPLSQLEAPIDKAPVKMKQTGRTDAILGHGVEEWALDDSTFPYTVSVWATKDYQAAFNFLISLQKTAPNEGLILGRMGKALISQGWFPLAATAKDSAGAVTLEMRVLEITPKKVDAKDVSIPAGFGKMSDMLRKKK